MTYRWHKNLIKALLILMISILMSGCGALADAPTEESSRDGGSKGTSSSQEDSRESASGKKTGSGESGAPSGDFDAGEFLDAAFSEANAQGNEEALVDTSSVSKGYVALFCQSDARLKLQVLKDDQKYVYDIVQGVPQIYPLQCGDGHYVFSVMKNIEDSKYYELYRAEADVVLDSEFEPFLRPNQYTNYSAASECVKKAGDLAGTAGSESDFVTAVYDFVCGTVKYDYELAATVQSGYLPEPDRCMSEGKGICFDYASLAAAMLRSQGIPTKIIFGYVSPSDVYHAWNMYYTKEDGWVAVEFKVDKNNWNRIDLTFSANGEDSDFIGDGSNYTDVYQY